jgi:hypothetical protein
VTHPRQHDDFAALHERLVAQEATTATLRAEVARLRRRRLPRRALPLLLAALLVVLIPLGTLAANPFTDLNPNSVHNPNIDAIYTAGITTGCDPGVAYCPNGLVTREEMASFLARTAGLGNNPPVANAKTAQTAQSATTAQDAGNAAAVGGYPAPALNRVSFDDDVLAATLANNVPYLDVARVGITIPGPTPQVVVRAQISILDQLSGGRVYGFLRSDTGDNSPVVYYPYLTSSANTGITATKQWAFVAQPGARTYTLRLAAEGLVGPLFLKNPALIATAHPFGPTGAPGTADLPAAP